jgi:predicted regulator of Ras-like GTPase activity (Roadblock/LC7/MglB family)
MKRSWTISMLLLVATAAWSAAPPESINYQGVLRDASDDPLDGDFDMVFRFWDAETGGLILLTDSHEAAETGAVTVTGGLFNVRLGGGALTAGVYSTLAEVFADESDVWLQIQVGTEMLNPRVRIVSAGYALNASHLEGRAAAEFLDTSSASQRKFGPLWVDASAIAEWGVRGAGQTGGGYFWDSDGSGYGYVGHQDLGILAQGDFAGGYFKDRVQSGFAYAGTGETGIEAYGNQSGGYFADLDGSGHAYLGFGDRGIHALGNEMGGYFKDNDDSGYAELGAQNIGVKGYGSFLGGYFADSDGSGYARVGFGDRGIEAYGNQYAGYFVGAVHVTGDLVANIVQADTIEVTAGGIKFPDGTVQTSSTGLANLGSRLDTAGSVGSNTSIAIGTDDGPVISYYDATNGNLKLAHCDNALCSSATLSLIDGSTDTGLGTSIAIGTDGLPVISYYDVANGDLRVAHCITSLCSGGTNRTTLDSAGDVGLDTSIAIGADGLPVISYYDLTNGDLRVAHCDDLLCSSAALSTLDSAGDVGRETSIAIGADDLPVISYRSYGNADLKVAHCDDVVCSSATLNTLDSAGDVGMATSIAIGLDGLPVISYRDSTNADLKVAHCDDVVCSSSTLNILDSAGDVGLYTSIAVGTDGLPVISYYDNTNDDLKVAHCDDALCSGAILDTLDSWGSVGWSTSIAIGADGKPAISYYDATNFDLKVMTQVTIAGGGGGFSKAARLEQGDTRPGVAPGGETVTKFVSIDALSRSTGDVSAGADAVRTDDEGNVYAKSFRPSDTDFATRMTVAERVETGDVLVIDPERPGMMSLARLPADSAVLGIVAGEPGVLLGAEAPDEGAEERGVPGQQRSAAMEATVAVSGVALCKVDAGYGPIRPGDLLTTSPTPGHAMLAYEPRPGTILGKALEPLDTGAGLIKVLVMLR